MHTFPATYRWSRERLAGMLLACAVGSSVGAAPAKGNLPPELEAETLTTRALPTDNFERIYVADVVIGHLTDGRIRAFDARDGKLLGMIDTGFVGNFTLSANSDELYVATSYNSRNAHGDRTDVLEVHDTQTLGLKYEIVLPKKRAQALTYRGLIRVSGNGRFVMVQNATPATSISVVDLKERKVVTEVQTPGCWGIMPAASHGTRFSMLCGDGKVATVTLDESGQVADRALSEKLFDADLDAWFHHAEQAGDRYWFVSFKGNLTELNLGGPVAAQVSQRALVNAADARKGWRPGGYQNFTVDSAGKWLVAAMHDKGTEGSHKRPAKELWVFDLATGKRVARHAGHMIAALTFSKNGQRLQALNGETGAMQVWRWDAKGKMKLMSSVKRAGETSILLESHD